MAVRDVVDCYKMDLAGQHFQTAIPVQFVENEPDRDRLEALWANFIIKTDRLLRLRRNRLVNPHSRRAVFSSGMENCAKISLHARKM
jgi:hypothetical protein